MTIPRNIQEELEKRDELILALELLVVDQACRLLAAEAVLRELVPPKRKPSQEKIEAHIGEAAERFRQRFEGESIAGFTDPGEASITVEIWSAGERHRQCRDPGSIFGLASLSKTQRYNSRRVGRR